MKIKKLLACLSALAVMGGSVTYYYRNISHNSEITADAATTPTELGKENLSYTTIGEGDDAYIQISGITCKDSAQLENIKFPATIDNIPGDILPRLCLWHRGGGF